VDNFKLCNPINEVELYNGKYVFTEYYVNIDYGLRSMSNNNYNLSSIFKQKKSGKLTIKEKAIDSEKLNYLYAIVKNKKLVRVAGESNAICGKWITKDLNNIVTGNNIPVLTLPVDTYKIQTTSHNVDRNRIALRNNSHNIFDAYNDMAKSISLFAVIEYIGHETFTIQPTMATHDNILNPLGIPTNKSVSKGKIAYRNLEDSGNGIYSNK
jgi:hypothetical protein